MLIRGEALAVIRTAVTTTRSYKNMSYLKKTNHHELRDNLIALRTSTKDRFKAEELKSLMNCSYMVEAFRKLLDESYAEYAS